MKYADLVGSGYLVINEVETAADNASGHVFYDVLDGYEIRVKGARIGGISRFMGTGSKSTAPKTYVVEFIDYMGEGRSQFDRLYLDEDVEVVIYKIEKTLVAGG